jgi:L-amino acid N-acyltransferase
MSFSIVHCTPDAHAVAIRDIYNDAIVNTTALYEYQPRSMADVMRWFGDKASFGLPVLAAQNESGELCGFASYGSFRPHAAYKYTIEHSVYVHPEWRRQGVARQLMLALIAKASQAQYRTMIGGIDAENVASIQLHLQLGFAMAGTVKQAGYKFGRWLDLALYQLILPGPDVPVEH